MHRGHLIIVLVSLILFTFNDQRAQGITIPSGAIFNLGGARLNLPSNLYNSGTFNAGTGTVIFNGSANSQIISCPSCMTFNNLTINKASGEALLSGDISIDGSLTLTQGDLNMNGNAIILNGTLSESPSNTVKGNGELTCSSTLNAPNQVNPHGIGVEISSEANLGNCTLIRRHIEQVHDGNKSILRYFDISPANNSALNASLIFHYDGSELNSLAEASLSPFLSTDNGTNWILINGSLLNAADKTISFSGLSSLSRFTLASSANPLPVELTGFSAEPSGSIVILTWSTASEINNYGFNVDRVCEERGSEWEKIGFVSGHGNSNVEHEYSYVDKTAPSGKVSYRIKQVDNNGKYKYYDAVTVNVDAPKEYKLMQNSPNPFNPTTAIKFQIPENIRVSIKIYDLIGCEVTTLVNEEKPAGSHIVYWNGKDKNNQMVSSGVYLYRLTAGSYSETRKMNLLK